MPFPAIRSGTNRTAPLEDLVKNILLLSTGGTIACTPTAEGLVPTLSAADIVAFVPEIADICRFDAITVFNLDSSNIQPEEWLTIAHAVAGHLSSYDGVVILHGTDTMAYTASMLSFMLRSLDKPVIITGSQLPMTDPATDAKANLLHAFLTAVAGPGGVFIVFDGKIIKGTRVTKMRTISLDAFESINASLAGRIVDGAVVLDPSVNRPVSGPTVLDDQIDTHVFLLKLIPGTQPELFDHLQALGYRGLVIEGFGLGGVHFVRRNILLKLQQLAEAGVAVLLTSQCPFEISDLSVYETGRKALAAGIIPGYDMTSETAVTKLMWVLGHTNRPAEVQEMMHTDYCGEVTVP